MDNNLILFQILKGLLLVQPSYLEVRVEILTKQISTTIALSFQEKYLVNILTREGAGKGPIGNQHHWYLEVSYFLELTRKT